MKGTLEGEDRPKCTTMKKNTTQNTAEHSKSTPRGTSLHLTHQLSFLPAEGITDQLIQFPEPYRAGKDSKSHIINYTEVNN